MFLTFHVRFGLFFGMLKRQVFTRIIYAYFHKKLFFPSLPNLGAQIRCAQNRYIAVQRDLKHPLICSMSTIETLQKGVKDV